MVSKTKFLLDDETIKRLFERAGITGVTSVLPLGAGEFNAVYEVIADKAYVLKAAPKRGTRALTYENDMLFAEKYYRYTKRSFGWWRSVFACIGLYCVSFKGFKNAKQ